MEKPTIGQRLESISTELASQDPARRRAARNDFAHEFDQPLVSGTDANLTEKDLTEFASKQVAIALAVQEHLFLPLASKGIMGVFPRFIRSAWDQYQILQFTLDKRGAGFFLDIGAFHKNDAQYADRVDRFSVGDLPRRNRKRLPVRKSGLFAWMHPASDSEMILFDESDPETACSKAFQLVETQGEAWWRKKCKVLSKRKRR